MDATERLIAAYATNNRINVYLIQKLPPAAWRAKMPDGKGRDIASIIGHMHNVRLMWLKSALNEASAIPKLEGAAFTPEEAIAALEESWAAMSAVLQSSMEGNGKIRGFQPDVYSFIGYLLAHDAHHRGQAAMLARQVGHKLAQSAAFGMWEWGVR